MLEPIEEYKADHKGKYTRQKELGSRDNPWGDIKHCPIWGENYKADGFIAWEYEDRVISKSPRTGGSYVTDVTHPLNNVLYSKDVAPYGFCHPCDLANYGGRLKIWTKNS